jgi:mono/diheme cytochrome c family protein
VKALICVLTGLFLAVAWASVGSPLQQAPAAAASLKNPLECDARARRAGAKLYVRECAACHGLDRAGRATAPPLNATAVSGAPAGALFWVLRNGSLKRGMPSFAHLPEPQRWQIITYLRGEQCPALPHINHPGSRRCRVGQGGILRPIGNRLGADHGQHQRGG